MSSSENVGGDPDAPQYDFLDVLNSIRNNETRENIIKKTLSAAAALSARSSSSPMYMMWTIPTTVLAILGVVYFISEYKSVT